MSKYSPIFISDTEDSDNEDKEEGQTQVVVISDDENTNSINDSFQGGKFAESDDKDYDADSAAALNNEPASSSKPTAIPKSAVTLNRQRLQWLSCKIKLAKTQSKHGFRSVKNEDPECEFDKLDNGRDTPPALDHTQVSQNKDKKEKQKIQSNVEEMSSCQVKKKTASSKLFESSNKQFSPLKDDLKDDKSESIKSQRKTSGTPKKKTSLERISNSPRKVGAFGSPEKPLKQSTLSKDSFSPKKLMSGPEDKIDDNSFHIPPLHATQISGYGTALHCNKTVLSLMDSQVEFLEGIKEEQFYVSYIDSLLDLVTVSRKPSPELCFNLLRELLLMSHSHSLSTKTYTALKRIQAIHPVAPEEMVISFDFLDEIVERLEMKGCTCKHQFASSFCLKASNALKTLTFLVDLMEMQVQRKLSLQKTIAFRLVSLQRNPEHIVKMLSWLSTSIKLCCQNSCSSSNHLQILALLQRLIQLSISTSENLDQCAEKLAKELITTYSQLPSLECRTLLLQTLPSHLVRSKFLGLYIEVFCEKVEESHGDSKFTGIQQIVRNHFEYLPFRRDDVEKSESRRCSGFHRSDKECEEHAMIITYSLQSYVFCHHKKLQRSGNRLTIQDDGLQEAHEPPNRRHLSMLDVDELVNMGDKVDLFEGRLFSLCPSLTARTNQLLGVLSDMKMWDPW